MFDSNKKNKLKKNLKTSKTILFFSSSSLKVANNFVCLFKRRRKIKGIENPKLEIKTEKKNF